MLLSTREFKAIERGIYYIYLSMREEELGWCPYLQHWDAHVYLHHWDAHVYLYVHAGEEEGQGSEGNR